MMFSVTVRALTCAWLAAAPGLTLRDALAQAKEHNKDLAAARAHLQQSRVGVEQAWNALEPTVSLNGKYTHNYKGATLPLGLLNQGTLGLAQTLQAADPTLKPALSGFVDKLNGESLGTITIQKEEQLDSSLNATVPVLVPAAYPALSAARRTYAASQANFEVTQTSLLFSVAQAFFAAAGAEELVAARENAVSLAKKTVKDSQVKLDNGTARSTDVNRAQVALLQAQQTLLEAEDSRRQAYRSLATLTQHQGSFEVAPTDISRSDSDDVPTLVEKAESARPELRFYAQSASSAQASESSADWRWAPTLSLFGRGALSNYQGFTGDYYAWDVGVSLDWVLYDGGGRLAQKHLAQAQRAEAELHLASQADTIRNELQNAVESLRTSKIALSTADQSRALSQRTLELTRVQYEAGIATQLDVLQAQDTLVSSTVQLAQAHFNLALAELAVERSAGLFPENRL